MISYKILILEDDQERIQKFREIFKYHDLTVTSIVSSCIQALENNDYDYLYLDHDLDGKVFVDSFGDIPTGWHVAKWLSEHENRQPKVIVLHSLNENGRKNMEQELPDAIALPYAWEILKVEENGEIVADYKILTQYF